MKKFSCALLIAAAATCAITTGTSTTNDAKMRHDPNVRQSNIVQHASGVTTGVLKARH